MLVKKGAKVFVAGRDKNKVKTAIEMIISEVPAAKISSIELDLADLDSVARCARKVLQKYQRLDL